MKNQLTITFILLSFLIVGKSFGQTTITLQPDGVTGKDAYIQTSLPSTPQPNYTEFDAIDWTVSGNEFTSRSFLQFDLSQIPVGSTINSAFLSLYGVPGSGNSQGSTGSNTCNLQRVTSAWDENTITWSNQPTATNQNQVTLNQSSSTTQNYLDVDVTNLFQDIVDNAGGNFGILIKLVSEQLGNSMVLGSSDNTDAAKHPKLVITYTPEGGVNCVTLQGNNVSSTSYLHSMFPSTNYGNYVEFDAIDWTVGGNPFTSRSSIEFDYSSIPANAVISSATLSLFGNPTSGNTQGSTGSNTCYLQRITSAWDVTTVTWDNQPTTTTVNQVTIPASSSISQDYPSIDITDLVIDDINDVSNSGFILRLQSEVLGNSMVFCGPDFSNAAKRPKLVVCYTIPNSVTNNITEQSTFNIYPNPSQDYFFLSGKNNFKENLSTIVYDVNGKEILNRNLSSGIINEKFDLSEISSGIYFIKLFGNNFEQHFVFSKQ